MKQPTHEELAEAAMPLLNLLNKYYDPHCSAIISEGRVEVVTELMGTPLPIRD